MLSTWRWSDDPKVWFEQTSQVFGVLTTFLTGVYVWLTYRLMRSTARTAQLAFVETVRSRADRLRPLKRALMSLQQTMKTLGDQGSPAEAAPVLAAEWLQLAPQIDDSREMSENLRPSLRECGAKVEKLLNLVNRSMAVAGGAKAEIQRAVEECLVPLELSLATIDGELIRSQRIAEEASRIVTVQGSSKCESW